MPATESSSFVGAVMRSLWRPAKWTLIVFDPNPVTSPTGKEGTSVNDISGIFQDDLHLQREARGHTQIFSMFRPVITAMITSES